MPAISHGFKLALQAAAAETFQSQHQFIETGHLYIRICRFARLEARRFGASSGDCYQERPAGGLCRQEVEVIPMCADFVRSCAEGAKYNAYDTFYLMTFLRSLF
jgi:hypothetical protein